MNVVRKGETYALEDIYALPDGKRAELIDGQIYYMAPPNTRHQMHVMDYGEMINEGADDMSIAALNKELERRFGFEMPLGYSAILKIVNSRFK